MSFIYAKTLVGSDGGLFLHELEASVTVNYGDALKFSANGKLTPVSSQTDAADFIMADQTSITTTASGAFYANVNSPQRGEAIFKVGFTPLINKAAISSGTSTSLTIAVATAGITNGSANDLQGGLVYHAPTGSVRRITSNSYASNNLTVNFSEPLGYINTLPVYPMAPAQNAVAVTPAAGDLMSLVPFGLGSKGLKFASTNPQANISTARGDTTGGNIQVHSVNFPSQYALVRFLAS